MGDIKVSIDLTSKEIERSKPPKATDIPVFATNDAKAMQRLRLEAFEDSLAGDAERAKRLKREQAGRGSERILNLEGVEPPTDLSKTKKQLDTIFTFFRSFDRANLISGYTAGAVRGAQTLLGSDYMQDLLKEETNQVEAQRKRRQQNLNSLNRFLFSPIRSASTLKELDAQKAEGLPVPQLGVGQFFADQAGGGGKGGGGKGTGFLGGLMGGGGPKKLLPTLLTLDALLVPIMMGINNLKTYFKILQFTVNKTITTIQSLDRMMASTVDQVRKFNGQVAQAVALRERENIMARMEQGRQVGDILADREAMRARSDVKMIELQTELIRVFGPISNAFNETYVNDVLDLLRVIASYGVEGPVPQMVKIQGLIYDGLELILDNLPYLSQIRDLLNKQNQKTASEIEKELAQFLNINYPAFEAASAAGRLPILNRKPVL